ncbi:MAG: HAD-IIA family hydrolase [Actinomycetaceae bacterium]|nr:HAD-IIA family hydrolase [Arcanobacterium sp.]MDD7504399.1 HAD-IIA family hydrolase [Actinomycetaceae bacterium]MDY6143587.1 HAD-IIA family hydrolase [Arcanobacterium sp.]
MESLLSGYDAVFSDLDGVAYYGALAAPYAPEFFTEISRMGMGLAFLTNNSRATPCRVADLLVKLGIPAEPDQVFTSARASVEQALDRVPRGEPVMVLGGEGIRQALTDAGYTIVTSADEHPRAVFQGLAEDANWRDLSEAAIAIDAGALFFATNMDRRIPKENGLMLGNGSLVNALIFATGIEPYVAGKPEAAIFSMARQALGVTSPLMIGDGLVTDIRGANRCGIPSVHVLTGTARPVDVMLAMPSDRPSYLCLDLRDVLQRYERVRADGEWIYCGNDGALANDTGLHTSSSPQDGRVSITQYRAAVHALWKYMDSLGESERLAYAELISTQCGELKVVHN